MNTCTLRTAALAGLITLASLLPALAQEAAPSMTCRLFPLRCPGPVPTRPTPLLGTPEEQAQEAPPPAEVPVKHKHRVRKHTPQHVPN